MRWWEMEFIPTENNNMAVTLRRLQAPASGRQHGRVSEEMNWNPHSTIRDFFYLPEVGGRFRAQTCSQGLWLEIGKRWEQVLCNPTHFDLNSFPSLATTWESVT